CQQDNSNPLTF
nr:immunoglobulin light chain junction region [Macaca mulatta]